MINYNDIFTIKKIKTDLWGWLKTSPAFVKSVDSINGLEDIVILKDNDSIIILNICINLSNKSYIHYHPYIVKIAVGDVVFEYGAIAQKCIIDLIYDDNFTLHKVNFLGKIS